MARITLTSLFSDLNDWPGRLFDSEEGGSILTRTAKAFTWRFGPDADFAGYEIRITGKGFTYDGGEATAGRMSDVRIVDGSSQTVLTFAELKGGLAGDFANFWYNFFGSSIPDQGPGPDGTAVWSHLMSGNDRIIGDASHDYQGFPGLDLGNDIYEMGDGDSYINGGIGNDTYVGGDGYDIISYDRTHYNEGLPIIRGATVNLSTGVALDPWGGRDALSGFDEARGSRLGDLLIGNEDRNRFYGLRGADTIDGGNNTFTVGGELSEDRRDEARYHQDRDKGGFRGIVVDLETSFANESIRGRIRDGFGHTDIVIDIERVVGTFYDDVFVGSRVDNRFQGAEGRDSYNGEDGWDYVGFDRGIEDEPNGVVIDLTRSSGQIVNDGFGNTETVRSIESFGGTRSGDRFTGNAAGDYFEGLEGADTMTGGGGEDYFAWLWEGELGQGDRITDFRSGTDKLAFDTFAFAGMTGTATLVNGRNATEARGTFIFDASNDTLYWDSDGTGSANKVAIVVLTGVAQLAVGDFDLWT